MTIPMGKSSSMTLAMKTTWTQKKLKTPMMTLSIGKWLDEVQSLKIIHKTDVLNIEKSAVKK